jgi:hypothetical protein
MSLDLSTGLRLTPVTHRSCPFIYEGPDMGGNREDGSGDGLGSAELPSLAHPLLRSRLVPSALEEPDYSWFTEGISL